MPNPGKILVVEDSPTMCRLYLMVLASLGPVQILIARDGVEGLDRAAQEPDLDLLIVDINMPRMDGLEFLRRLRGELRNDAPAVVISTEGDESDRRAAMEAGANAYLRKPWTPEELLDTVRSLHTPASP